MNNEVKDRIFSIISKLYISFGVISLLIVLVYAYQGVGFQFKKQSIFKRAHSNLERVAEYNPVTSERTLEQGRLVVRVEQVLRIMAVQKGIFPPEDLEVNSTTDLIDKTCFDSEGFIVSRTSKCKRIHRFEPGTPFTELFKYLGIFIGVFAGLILFKKWIL